MDGSSTLDVVGPWTNGCWRQISSCGSQGMTIAFWVKLISGVENWYQSESLISAQNNADTEWWEILLLNWEGTKLIKFQVKDYQEPGIRFQKEVDVVTSLFGEWVHYVLRYKYENHVGAQFTIYKNGQLDNGGGSDAPYDSFTLPNMVDRLAFGRPYISSNSPPYANAVFDETLFFDGALSADLVDILYHHYI